MERSFISTYGQPGKSIRLTGRAARGMDAFMAWVDELARAQEERETVLRDVAARGLTPPKADDTPLTVRWACPKPSDCPSYVLGGRVYRVAKQTVEPGFGDLLRRYLQVR